METLRNYFTDEQIEIMESIHPGITEDPKVLARAKAMHRCTSLYQELRRQLDTEGFENVDTTYAIKDVDGEKTFCVLVSELNTPELKETVLNLIDTRFTESAQRLCTRETEAEYDFGYLG